MTVLKIKITRFSKLDEVDFVDFIYITAKETELNRCLIAKLYNLHNRNKLNPERILWSIVERIEVIEYDK